MNGLMNKVVQFRSQVDHAWKTPNTLDCLHLAAFYANKLRMAHSWLQNQDVIMRNKHKAGLRQELADTVIMLLTACANGDMDLTHLEDVDGTTLDDICYMIESCIHEFTISDGREFRVYARVAINGCRIYADSANANLDDIVKARLKGIARRNRLDESLVDNIWLKAEMLKVSDDHKPHRHYED